MDSNRARGGIRTCRQAGKIRGSESGSGSRQNFLSYTIRIVSAGDLRGGVAYVVTAAVTFSSDSFFYLPALQNRQADGFEWQERPENSPPDE